MSATTKNTPETKPLPEFRYYCDKCTGVAFLSVGSAPKHHPSNCENCGLVIGEIKPENFLPLEPNHPARLAKGAALYN